MNPTAAAIYCRISQDRSGDAQGVDRQEALCRKLAESKGWPVAEVYVDNDLSAYSGKPRPAYDRMLDDLTSGARDAVVCVDLDRLTRAPRELEDFIDLADRHGVALANVTGDVDLATSDGRFRARIMGNVARLEAENMSKRIKRERDQRAGKGLPHPGPRAFGFRDGNVKHDPKEARAIREAARRVLAGESLRSIAFEWNERDLRTARGNQWSVNSLRDVLTNPRTAGLRTHRGEIIKEGVWKPILDRETWERLVAMTERRKRPGRPATKLLSGILTCGICGNGMVSWTDHGKPAYRCQRQPSRRTEDPCGRLSIVAEQTERFVTEAVLHRLASSRLSTLIEAQGQSGAAAADAVAKLEEAEAKLDQLADDYAAGDVSRAMFLKTSQRLEDRVDKARRAVARASRSTALEGLPVDAEGLRRWWHRASVGKRRAVLQALLQGVEVSPADPKGPRRFQEDRLSPNWRA